MILTPAQKTTLKTHMQANTNVTALPGAGGQTFVINTRLATLDPSDEGAIADWYGGVALAGDNQPFATLLLWNPQTTVEQLNKAIDWTTPPPHGLGGSPTVDQQQLAINNQWWRWDQMTKRGAIDMTDAQVRNGVTQVWGNLASGTAANIGSATTLCGKAPGRRVDLALSPAAVGAKTAWSAVCVCPANVFGQPLSGSDVDDVLRAG
jgi:hypothetical protein